MGRSSDGAHRAAPVCVVVSRRTASSPRASDFCGDWRTWTGLVCALVCLALIAGCGSKKADSELVPVKGEFYYDAQPAEGALVILHPATGPDAAKWPHGLPHGTVGTDGAYNIGLPPIGDGAPAGEYKVLLTWNLPVPGSDPADSEPETFDKLGGRWATPEKTTLSATIQPPETVIPRFDLKSKK